MRQEFDEEADLARTVVSDKPIVGSREFMDGPIRHVMYFDANDELVQIEVYGYSKAKQRAEQTVRREFHADSARDEVIGDLGWSITETAGGTVLAEGRKDVRLGEMSIHTIQEPDKTLATKQLPLTEEFVFGVVTSLSTDSYVGGFALKADRTDIQTFCWDWFNVDGFKHATKLQEGGELRIGVSNPNSQWQIVRTEFLTDVSLRVFKPGDEIPLKPSWRLLVRKGSWVDWPCLVDDVVVACDHGG